MQIELTIYSALCSTEAFYINGIRADSGDFGDHYDHSPDDAEDYGCGDMQFTRNPPTQVVLEKYGITPAEYAFIASQLEEGLSFGSCGWCV